MSLLEAADAFGPQGASSAERWPPAIAPRAHPATLVDAFTRQLTYLRLSVTDFCNFRCDYCLPHGYPGKRPKNELSLPEIAHLLRAFARLGTQKVRLTGGEPSIRGDLPQIIALARQTPGIAEVAMTSNGYRLERRWQDWCAAGLTHLNLSVDSFDRQVFAQITGHDVLDGLLAGVDALLADGRVQVKLNGILKAQHAEDTLQDALAYVKDRPVTYRFIEFMQTRHNARLFFREHISGELIRSQLLRDGWQLQPRSATAGPAEVYGHADFVGRIGLIAPYREHFCQSCNRLRVSAQGKVHLCLFDRVNHDLRPWLQQGDLDATCAFLLGLMPIKPEHHHLQAADSGLMANLSLIGG